MLKLLFTLSAFLFFSGCSSKPQEIYYDLDSSKQKDSSFYDLKSASYKNMDIMLDKLVEYKIVFMGDHHNQDDLHQKMADIIRGLKKRKKKIILASEWFTPKDSLLLQSFIQNKIDEKTFLKKIKWKKSIGFKYATFRPIVKSLQSVNGNLVGINLSKKEQKQISKRDTKAMSQNVQTFYHKLDITLDAHKNYLKPYLNHCYEYDKGKEDCLQRMYRVQVAWDTKMAQEVFKLEKKLLDNEILLVLVGSMHLSKGLGINLRFSRLSNRPFFNLSPLDSKVNSVSLSESDAVLLYNCKNYRK